MDQYRELDKACFEKIKTIPGLQALIDHVCHHDPELSVEIRHNYLNCYYKGGSIFKLIFNQKTLTFEFDPKYFELDDPSRVDCAELKIKSKDPGQWLKQLGGLKRVMDAWFDEHPKAERGVQQELAKANTFANGSYQVIDIELAIPEHQKLGRMDLIAVRREGERYIPVIVELKHGTKAFNGSSGLKAHYKKATDFLQEPEGEPYLVETIRRIWDTKHKLGLIPEQAPAAGAFGKAELMFAVTGWKGGTAEKLYQRLSGPLERNVRAVISADQTLDFNKAELLH